jgi:hypothetical protein
MSILEDPDFKKWLDYAEADAMPPQMGSNPTQDGWKHWALVKVVNELKALQKSVESLRCIRCKAPWTSLGALEFSPPNLLGLCAKHHVCSKCYFQSGETNASG